MNYLVIVAIIMVIVSVTLVGYYIYDRFQTKYIDLMDEGNICRPAPDNTVICGESVLFQNATKSPYAFLILANGTRIQSDCLSDEYPRSQNSSGYSCADGVWKTLINGVRQ